MNHASLRLRMNAAAPNAINAQHSHFASIRGRLARKRATVTSLIKRRASLFIDTNRVPERQKLELPTEGVVRLHDIVRHYREHVIVINRESVLQESNHVESDQ